ncbi:MAG: exodeoxyribonuclease III [Prochlorothrix sp.]|nr:exodeoxyribonuclease III [Prochlorothrix sp.]
MTTLATWNVNSIRTRLEQVCSWLQSNPVDVLCLQETKVMDDQFPRAELEALGYHCHISGQKSYNGVALLSRSPLSEVRAGFSPVLGIDRVRDFDDQKRVISGKLGNLRILNLYVPNGSSLESEKYPYKLEWLSLLRDYVAQTLAEDPELHICGDFNIALEDRDIHDPVGKDQRVMATPAEREALQRVLDLGFRDVFRRFNRSGEQFSWWDYRSGSFAKNKGWRIDHHYLSLAAYDRAVACHIDKAPRSWEKPSDHAPVVLQLNAC